MTRQTWQITIGACLCLGLLPGCQSLFTLFDRNKTVEDPQKGLKDGQTTRTNNLAGAQGNSPRDGDPGSPYSPHGRSPQVLDLRYPDGSRSKQVLPFDVKEAQIPDPPAGADEHQEPPHSPNFAVAGHQPPSPPQPAPAPPPEEPLVIALARLIKEDKADDRSLALLDRYDPVRRELFQRLLPVLATLNKRSVAQLPPEEMAIMQDQLQGLLLKLRASADLVIDKLCYCQPERGRYKPLPREHPFLARSGDRPGELVCLYVELRNLGTVRNGDFYETRISSAVKIYENGVQKFARSFNDRPLRSPDLSGDFFNTYSFYMPAGIPPGRYDLVLEVRDETTQPPRIVSNKEPLKFVVAAETPGN